ncbi:hypothetical protein XU18_2424 [Perkinsela sp. CCAP 1560/4]|nr:hypothetical protein XU18_2424 [Perkinsela sp. CCAP 1560/4]|eukprot:KNH06822.1 hypothetical protein XU18_2424 [Perkinsela sp. CCAP 1560/4]
MTNCRLEFGHFTQNRQMAEKYYFTFSLFPSLYSLKCISPWYFTRLTHHSANLIIPPTLSKAYWRCLSKHSNTPSEYAVVEMHQKTSLNGMASNSIKTLAMYS